MTDRNLTPHAEARLAMALWGSKYAQQNGGCMDFWDALPAARKALTIELLDAIIPLPRVLASGHPTSGDDAIIVWLGTKGPEWRRKDRRNPSDMGMETPREYVRAGSTPCSVAMISAAERIIETYAGMEDGNGDPCPDIAALRSALQNLGEVGGPAPLAQLSLDEVYVIPREMTDEEWSEVKYNVDRKANPDIDLWRIKEAVKYANFIAGHRGRKMIQTPAPAPQLRCPDDSKQASIYNLDSYLIAQKALQEIADFREKDGSDPATVEWNRAGCYARDVAKHALAASPSQHVMGQTVRELAVEIVDGVSGYTIERSPHRETHGYHYDQVEERINALLSNPSPQTRVLGSPVENQPVDNEESGDE